MRHTYLFLCSLILLFGCSSSKDFTESTRVAKGKAEEHRTVLKIDGMILGEFDIGDLRTDEFSWFDKTFNEYESDTNKLDNIEKGLQQIKIICFAGTWCSDTHRELPRMWRILFDAKTDPDIMKMYGIDRNKMSPNGEALKHQITLSPTFIFLRNGVEIGRIEEQPKKSLEADMLEILNK